METQPSKAPVIDPVPDIAYAAVGIRLMMICQAIEDAPLEGFLEVIQKPGYVLTDINPRLRPPMVELVKSAIAFQKQIKEFYSGKGWTI